MINATRKLTAVAKLWPAERVSNGWISDGISQPNGPQDLLGNTMKDDELTTLSQDPLGRCQTFLKL